MKRISGFPFTILNWCKSLELLHWTYTFIPLFNWDVKNNLNTEFKSTIFVLPIRGTVRLMELRSSSLQVIDWNSVSLAQIKPSFDLRYSDLLSNIIVYFYIIPQCLDTMISSFPFSRHLSLFQALSFGIGLLKVNNRNTRTRCEICSRLSIKTSERRQCGRSGVFIVNFKRVIVSWATIDLGTKVSLTIFWNKQYNVAANGSLDIAKKSGGGE